MYKDTKVFDSILIFSLFSQIIEPFPRPNNKLSNQVPLNKLVSDSNNCDIDYLKKSNATIPLKLYDTETMPSSSQIANEAMKQNGIRELLETEENYVKLLSSLCFGYIILLQKKKKTCNHTNNNVYRIKNNKEIFTFFFFFVRTDI